MEYELILKPLSALAPRDDPKYAAKMSEQIKRYVSQRFLEQLRSEELYTSGCLLRIMDPSAAAVATNFEKSHDIRGIIFQVRSARVRQETRR